MGEKCSFIHKLCVQCSFKWNITHEVMKSLSRKYGIWYFGIEFEKTADFYGIKRKTASAILTQARMHGREHRERRKTDWHYTELCEMCGYRVSVHMKHEEMLFLFCSNSLVES